MEAFLENFNKNLKNINTKKKRLKKQIILGVIGFFILGIVFFWTTIGSEINQNKEYTSYLQNSDYYFKGNIIESKSLVSARFCLIIDIDTISIQKTAKTKYYAGAYNKEKGLVAFYGSFNPDIIPQYITVNSKKNSVIYNNALTPDLKIRLLRFYQKDFTKVLENIEGNWEWF